MKDELMSRIVEAVKEEIGVESTVQPKEVKKNNGLVRQAVEILGPGSSVGVCIYIDSLLKEVDLGRCGAREAAREIAKIQREYAHNNEFVDIVNGLDKQRILEKVTYQLINEEKNRERLGNMPYRKFLDLAAIYRVAIGESEEGTDSFTMSNEICKKYGIRESELDDAARRNTEKMGFEVRTMTSILSEITGEPEDTFAGDPIWVFTNRQRADGASVMLYNEYFDKLACNVNDDLYILPSSIHEVIAIPAGGMKVWKLRLMVHEVNYEKVPADEVLSENVYKYSRKEGMEVIGKGERVIAR